MQLQSFWKVCCVSPSWTPAHKSQQFLSHFIGTISHLLIHPIHPLLQINGVREHVPYLGYIGTHITFPVSITGKEEQLIALTLVVPECHFNSKIPLLIGTNVLFRLYEQLFEQKGPDIIAKNLHSFSST